MCDFSVFQKINIQVKAITLIRRIRYWLKDFININFNAQMNNEKHIYNLSNNNAL